VARQLERPRDVRYARRAAQIVYDPTHSLYFQGMRDEQGITPNHWRSMGFFLAGLWRSTHNVRALIGAAGAKYIGQRVYHR